MIELFEGSVGSHVIIRLSDKNVTREVHFELTDLDHWTIVESMYNILAASYCPVDSAIKQTEIQLSNEIGS
jgi:hypothetical protein